MSNARGPNRAAYQKAYNAQPEQVKKREERNLARAKEIKAGAVSKGDGKDVDHTKPLASGGSNNPDNWRVRSETANRGWRKGKSGYNP